MPLPNKTCQKRRNAKIVSKRWHKNNHVFVGIFSKRTTTSLHLLSFTQSALCRIIFGGGVKKWEEILSAWRDKTFSWVRHQGGGECEVLRETNEDVSVLEPRWTCQSPKQTSAYRFPRRSLSTFTKTINHFLKISYPFLPPPQRGESVTLAIWAKWFKTNAFLCLATPPTKFPAQDDQFWPPQAGTPPREFGAKNQPHTKKKKTRQSPPPEIDEIKKLDLVEKMGRCKLEDLKT